MAKKKELKNVSFPSIKSRSLIDDHFLDQLQDNISRLPSMLINKSVPYEKLGERVGSETSYASESVCSDFTVPGAVHSATSWNNSSYVLANDGNEAYISTPGGTIIVDQFGFSVPGGSTVTSVRVQVEWRRTVAPGITGTLTTRITKDGGSNYGTEYSTTSQGTVTLGEGTMGLSLTPAEVNDDNNFQVNVSITTNGTGYIDVILCEVCYEDSSQTTTIATYNVATMPVDATAGSVMFADTGSDPFLQEDNDNLFWDDTNNRLGIGTNSPDIELHVAGEGAIIEGGVAVTEFPAGSTLVLGAQDASNEGGELQLQAPGGSYTTAWHMDNYQNALRFISNVNAGDSGAVFAQMAANHTTLYKALIVNEDANNIDSRMEGQSDVYCFYLDASANSIGLGTNTPAAKLDIDSNSNTQCLRLRGTAGTTEIADLYVGQYGELVISLTSGNDSAQYVDIRTEDENFGLILRESDGTGTDVYANLFVTDAADDYLSFNVTSGKNTSGLILTASNKVGIGGIPTLAVLEVVGNIAIGGSNNELRFYEGANYVGFEAPALSANKIWVLPAADGSSGDHLQTDGSGNLSWQGDSAIDHGSLSGLEDDDHTQYLLNTGDTGTGAYDFGGADSFEVPNAAGGTTVDAAGELTIDTTSKTLNFYDGAAEKVLRPELSKSITIEDPTNSEDISFFFTNTAITITEIRAVLVGSDTPSVTWTIRHGTDRSAAGAEVVTGGTTTTSTTTGSDVTSFNDATVVADSFIWIETTAQSGTVDELHITAFYTIDP